MASFKNSKNLLSQKSEYARYFDNLRGVDFSSDQNDVADSRLAYLVNMYRDYKSGQGGAIETIPGFRAIRDFGGQINGIHIGDGNIFIHIDSWLYQVGKIDEDGKVTIWDEEKRVTGLGGNVKSVSFYYQSKLYILCNGSYFYVGYDASGNNPYLVDVAGHPNRSYIPTTWKGIAPEALRDTQDKDAGEGKEFEQRNLLNPLYKVTFIAPGDQDFFELKEPIDCEFDFKNNRNNFATFSSEFDVYQYGVRLPLAYNDGPGVPRIPEGYPNAITYVRNDGELGVGKVQLVKSPPRPEKNTWNPDTSEFDYTAEEIEAGTPDAEKYNWPFAFSSYHDGIEITVTKNIKNLSGITNLWNDQAKIITNCRMAILFDNHVFLSGNPDYPRHIFYNTFKNDDSGVPDALFFGQLNHQMEGTSNSPVVAMMSVGDALMVIKQDSDEEDSLILHTSQTGSNLQPTIYPAQRGHKGIGCYGPCFNFRDDPIFLSKYGVDALGHVSTKYRRAIKHRSSLIDAKLLNCDLKNASMAEWGGYLLILTEGKIFMADSRQMYATDGNNTEYEWYYLEDIGVYTDQFDEYVFAEFETGLTKEEMVHDTGGVEFEEAHVVRDEFGVERHLIGTLAYESEDEIRSIVGADNKIFYYKEIEDRDFSGEPTGRGLIKYYVAPSGGKTGGTFDAAVMLKTIGEDLFFVTKNGVLCKFNFDMRDPETGLIPNEYYDFNGRTIFSGCATKMDNCGIPHLTKSTVKKSVVIKTRTFTHSGMKVKVRTNRNVFNQVDRIINGQATYDDPSFNEYTFNMTDKSIFSVNEREKKWVEKQIFIYSDEFRRPFALHYLAYRYNIAGRYKE